MGRVISVLCLILLVSLVWADKGYKKKAPPPVPKQVIILPAGPSVAYRWVGFGDFKGKKKVPYVPRPPFPSLLPAAQPVPEYGPSYYSPPAPYVPAVTVPYSNPAPLPPVPVAYPSSYAASAPLPLAAPNPYEAALPQQAAPSSYSNAAAALPAVPALEPITSPLPQYSQPDPTYNQAPVPQAYDAAPAAQQDYQAAAPQQDPYQAAAPQQDPYQAAVPQQDPYQAAAVPQQEVYQGQAQYEAAEPRPLDPSGLQDQSTLWGPVAGPFGGQAAQDVQQQQLPAEAVRSLPEEGAAAFQNSFSQESENIQQQPQTFSNDFSSGAAAQEDPQQQWIVQPGDQQPAQDWNAQPQQPVQDWNAQPQQPVQDWNAQPQQPVQDWNAQPQQPVQDWNAQPQQPVQDWNAQPQQPVQDWNAQPQQELDFQQQQQIEEPSGDQQESIRQAGEQQWSQPTAWDVQQQQQQQPNAAEEDIPQIDDGNYGARLKPRSRS